LPQANLPLQIELGAIARNKSTSADRVLRCKNTEVYMRHLALSIVGAAAPRLRFPVITALLALMTLPLLAQEQPIPAELSFLNKLGKPYRITYEPWTEMQIPQGNRGMNGVGKVVRGKHWQFPVIVSGATTPEAVWAIIKPAFLANGWTAVHEWSAGGIELFLHYQKDGVEAWAETDPSPERASVEIVEIAPIPFTFTLKPPAATPEPVSATAGDFPWLGPLPGWQFRSSVADTDPFRVSITGAAELELVAPSSIIKTYRQPPDGMSNSLFHAAYHDALIKAGWTILYDRQDVSLTAHFTQNGRNLWATLYKGEFNEIRVADAGAVNKDLGSNLKTNCHVAVYGVLFDFNKSTLQPASDPVLQQILDLLKKTPTLKIEVQGHTDNVGGDAYNQTLSEARAKAIVTWLAQHGIAGDRLTAKGFGKTRPIADNATDAGRAKNRRVEIADPNCAAHSK
jgi:outer membrane protein OmpA-like peptidoglycan-associated protein